jgi:hypothetical protein
MSLRRGVMVVVAFALAKLTAANPEWCRVRLDNRESARPVYVYDTITTRGTAVRLPGLPYFKRVLLTREVT